MAPSSQQHGLVGHELLHTKLSSAVLGAQTRLRLGGACLFTRSHELLLEVLELLLELLLRLGLPHVKLLAVKGSHPSQDVRRELGSRLVDVAYCCLSPVCIDRTSRAASSHLSDRAQRNAQRHFWVEDHLSARRCCCLLAMVSALLWRPFRMPLPSLSSVLASRSLFYELRDGR